MNYSYKCRGRVCAPPHSTNPNGAVVPLPAPVGGKFAPRQVHSYQNNDPNGQVRSSQHDSYISQHPARGTSSLEWNDSSNGGDIDRHSNKNPHPLRHNRRRKPSPPPNDSEHYKLSYFYSPSRSKEPSPPYHRRGIDLISPQQRAGDKENNKESYGNVARNNHNQLPSIEGTYKSAVHHPTGNGSQNTGNCIGTKSTIRQSKYFRMYESGNQTKGLLGQDNLCWNTDYKQGAYGGKVYDASKNGISDKNYKYGNNSEKEQSLYYTEKYRSKRYPAEPTGDSQNQRSHIDHGRPPPVSENQYRNRRRSQAKRQEYDMWSTTSRASY